jgi:hypothetical protein
MVGAASLGGSAWDWLERTRGHVVVVDHWQGVHVSRSVEAFMRDPGAG